MKTCKVEREKMKFQLYINDLTLEKQDEILDQAKRILLENPDNKDLEDDALHMLAEDLINRSFHAEGEL